jgi:hypothetical protein
MTSPHNQSPTFDAIGLGYPDLRNSTVIDVIRALKGFRCDVSVCVHSLTLSAVQEYGVMLLPLVELPVAIKACLPAPACKTRSGVCDAD